MPRSLYHADYEALRARLRSARMRAGLTQAQMARALRVGQSYVSKLERGENFMDVLLFARWFQVCRLKPGAVLDGLLDRAVCGDEAPDGDAVGTPDAAASHGWGTKNDLTPFFAQAQGAGAGGATPPEAAPPTATSSFNGV